MRLLRPLLRILRATTLSLLALLLLAFALVQFQQRLLRHRAEKLNADIAYLRDHPGTWTDLQRIQQRWGAFAHYDGTCNVDHCDYMIHLEDFYFLLGSQHFLDVSPIVMEWSPYPYTWLGGRPTTVDAELRLTKGHLWGVRMHVATGVIPGLAQKLHYSGYMLIADVYFGPRLFNSRWERPISLEAAREGYLTGRPGGCENCINRWISLTPATAATDRNRLAAINFSCITRFRPCADVPDILPGVAAQDEVDEKSPVHLIDPKDGSGDPRCEVPLATRATEADNIMAVEILSSREHKDAHGEVDDFLATAKVIEKLKNAPSFHVGDTIQFFANAALLNPPPTANAAKVLPLTNGTRYIALFAPPYSQGQSNFDLEQCSAVLDRDSARSEIAQGIAKDPSTGEDYRSNH